MVMADLATLRTRLLARLPGRTNDELDGWLLESAIQHGYATIADVPANKETMVILYARYMGLQAKAAETAENADLSISGKISVNKTSASGNYNNLVAQAWKDYKRAGGTLSGSRASMVSLTRADGR